MKKLNTPVHQAVRDAIARGSALNRAEVRALQEKHELAVKLYKLAFWLLDGIFVVLLLVDLPITIDMRLRYSLAFVALVLAILVPLIGIRRHNRCLIVLEGVEPGPKKRRADEAGKGYIEQVRKDGRTFTRAELEILEASRSEEAADAP